MAQPRATMTTSPNHRVLSGTCQMSRARPAAVRYTAIVIPKSSSLCLRAIKFVSTMPMQWMFCRMVSYVVALLAIVLRKFLHLPALRSMLMSDHGFDKTFLVSHHRWLLQIEVADQLLIKCRVAGSQKAERVKCRRQAAHWTISC